jgi:hypothetical protein
VSPDGTAEADAAEARADATESDFAPETAAAEAAERAAETSRASVPEPVVYPGRVTRQFRVWRAALALCAVLAAVGVGMSVSGVGPWAEPSRPPDRAEVAATAVGGATSPAMVPADAVSAPPGIVVAEGCRTDGPATIARAKVAVTPCIARDPVGLRITVQIWPVPGGSVPENVTVFVWLSETRANTKEERYLHVCRPAAGSRQVSECGPFVFTPSDAGYYAASASAVVGDAPVPPEWTDAPRTGVRSGAIPWAPQSQAGSLGG